MKKNPNRHVLDGRPYGSPPRRRTLKSVMGNAFAVLRLVVSLPFWFFYVLITERKEIMGAMRGK